MNNATESALIERCKQGDTDAFGELVIKHQKKVFNVALRMLDDWEEAKDVAQEAFIRAWRAIGTFRSDSSFFTWIYRIVFNLSKNRLKGWARRPRPDSIDAPVDTEDGDITRTLQDKEPSPDKILLKKETGRLVKNAIAELSIKHREIIIMRDIQGLSYQEIAEVIGCGEGTVKSRLSRARLILKEKLKEVVNHGL
ncbi:MAG: sigma-70 family RNA polymerase sigma factor [bacterium]